MSAASVGQKRHTVSPDKSSPAPTRDEKSARLEDEAEMPRSDDSEEVRRHEKNTHTLMQHFMQAVSDCLGYMLLVAAFPIKKTDDARVRRKLTVESSKLSRCTSR